MTDIILTTLNAKYIHTSFGLRYLYANMGDLQERTVLLEYTIDQRTIDIVERLQEHSPKIIGFGVYIWNVEATTKVIAMLKKLRPELVVVLGGPEISYETTQQEIVALSDFAVQGEGDLVFAKLCQQILGGEPPQEKILKPTFPAMDDIAFPYDFYSDHDLQNRVVYVELSRGCPFRCEFCLSSLDKAVRTFPIEAFFAHMEKLLKRGLKHFKFVDRTFNLNIKIGQRILQFFLERYEPGLFLHFEMIPDRFPEKLRDWIKKFPPGALQFEVGIQTFNPKVAALISRRQNYAKLEENLTFLQEETGVHVHADLIAGLPGEDLESFAAGFDQLISLKPQEIQVGILKRLRGTPIIRHTNGWEMVYSPAPPYEILQNGLLDFATMQRLRRFARFWDLVGNSGNFVHTLPHFWQEESPFWSFWAFSDWLYKEEKRTQHIALQRLMQRVLTYLTKHKGRDPIQIAQTLLADFQQGGKRGIPGFLKDGIQKRSKPAQQKNKSGLKRQARHLNQQNP